MIQLQYYNKGLTKAQIDQILNNYNLKYTTLTKEINSKLNSLIKTVLNDISPFLENIEEISKELKSLKEMDNHKRKIELLENKLHEKSIVEHQLQNDITSLKKEIQDLKEKNKQYDSTDNLINKNENFESPVKNKKKKKSIDMNISQEKKPIKNQNKKNDEIQTHNNNLNTHSRSTFSNKKGGTRGHQENKTSNYMMNLKEITRNLNNKSQANKINDKASKFIYSSSKKNTKKDLQPKKTKKHKSKSIDLSNAVDTATKNEIVQKKDVIIDKEKNNNEKDNNNNINNNNINNEQNKKNKNIDNTKDNYEKYYKENESNLEIIDEEFDEEIKELEIDEERILKLIEQIKNFRDNRNKIQ